MSDSIVINGRTVRVTDLQPDASGSNYIIIRTTGEPLRHAQKQQLTELGVNIQEFVGNETEQVYLCLYRDDPLDAVRALDYIDYANVYATKFAVPSQTRTDIAASASDVTILLHQDLTTPSDELLQKIAEATGLDVSAISVEDGVIRVRVDAETVNKVAALDEVRVIHTVQEPALFNNKAREILKMDTTAIKNTTKFTGKGQIVCVADTGFDTGSIEGAPAAFKGRVEKLLPWGRTEPSPNGNTDDPDGHGTHVCGSVLGNGQHTTQGSVQGTAPGATLIVQSTFSGFDAENRALLGGIPADHGLLFDQAYKEKARIHTNSWGVPKRGGPQIAYNDRSESIDKFIWNNPDMTVLFAAGNDGQDADENGVFNGKVKERSLGAQAAAKNCITVGATENNRPDLTSGVKKPNTNTNLPYTYGGFWSTKFTVNPLKDDHQANNPEGLAAFSSRGPTAENRLKPDVVAPGTGILSTRSRKKAFLGSVDLFGISGDANFMYSSGTSMATPLAAGFCAVVREALEADGYQDEKNGIKNPTGSLVKALLVNGAVPIKGQYMPREVGDEPNPHSGFGRLDLSGSLPQSGDARSGYGVGTVTSQNEAPVTVNVPAHRANSALTLKVTLVYADPPGGALQNDLNLAVIVGDRERHGNQWNTDFNVNTTTSYDRLNNVEQVVWPNISGSANAQVVIKPFRLLSPKVPFAYAWRFY